MNNPVIDFRPSSKNSSLIDVISLEGLHSRKNKLSHDPEAPHRLGFSILLYVQQRSGNHFIDFAWHRFEPGSLVLINKNQLNAFDLSHDPRGLVVLFTDELLEKIQQSMRSPIFSPVYFKSNYSPVLKASSLLQRSCKQLLGEIQGELAQPQCDQLVVMHLFSALFLLINREREVRPHDPQSVAMHNKFRRFVELLERRQMLSRNATDYAEQLGLSYKTLNQACKSTSGLTAKQMIDAFTILEAKRRLVVDQIPVQDIAFALGFEEVTNFTKYFKKHAGVPPSHFQQSAKLAVRQ